MEQKQPNIQTREDACRWAVMRVRALIADEADWVTNLANASAAIFECWKEVSWAGFYLMKNGELVLGPFQGKTGLPPHCSGQRSMRDRCGRTKNTAGSGCPPVSGTHRLRRWLQLGDRSADAAGRKGHRCD